MKFAIILILSGLPLLAHDIITTPITYSREVSRILSKHCEPCHLNPGVSFPLTTYAEVRPWAVAIREEILARRMPPWGAVKGFGDFSNDNSLTPEEIELIVKWTEGGVPEGDAKDLPAPRKLGEPKVVGFKARIPVTGTLRLKKKLRLTAIAPMTVPSGAEFQIVAELPNGIIEPLLWLKDYPAKFGSSFELRKPLILPAGTIIRGVPKDAKVLLLSAHQ